LIEQLRAKEGSGAILFSPGKVRAALELQGQREQEKEQEEENREQRTQSGLYDGGGVVGHERSRRARGGVEWKVWKDMAVVYSGNMVRGYGQRQYQRFIEPDRDGKWPERCGWIVDTKGRSTR